MLGSMLAEVFADLNPTLWDREDLDITDKEEVWQKIMELQPEVIINAAAYTDVDGAEENREAAFAVNETAVMNVASVASQIGATMVHYSTDYVFPGASEEGYSENDSPGPPVNLYGQSKLAGERALKEAGVTFYLLRTAWLYGPNGKNFVDTMLELGNTKEVLNVVEDQVGSPTFTKDVAMATRAVLEDEQFEPGIYHAVNEGRASWFEFAKEIFRIVHGKVNVKPVLSEEFVRPAKRPAFSVLQNTKGLPMRPWQKALDDYLRNYH